MENNIKMLGPFELDTIVCADSYDAIKLIPDKSVDCIYSDIPYLYNQGGGGPSELGERTAKKRLELMGIADVYEKHKCPTRGEALRIAKNIKKASLDVTSIEDGIDYAILDEFVRVMKKINIFIWCSKLQIFDIMKFFLETLKTKDCYKEKYKNTNIYFEILCWAKTNPTPSTNNNWLPDIEYCLYFREQGVPLNDGYEYKSKFYVSPANVGDKGKFSHPTIKPLNLVEQHLKHASQNGDIIFDPFIGSGTTAVAVKNIGGDRHFIGFDIEQKWVDIANNRLNNIDNRGQYSMFTK